MTDTSKIPPERIEVNWDEIGRDYTDKEINKSRTNCIISAPNNIKLELNEEILTLKSGSKLYDAKGNSVTLNSDLTYTITYTTRVLCYALVTKKSNQIILISVYNDSNLTFTENTVMYKTEECWLPFAMVTRDVTGKSSINKVFNEFSAIGSSYFLLPNVKFLFANGYNDDDGSVKNIEWTSDKVYTVTRTWNVNNPQKLFILYNHSSKMWFENNYFVQEEEPTIKVYTIWYKPSVRKTYYWGGLTGPQEWREYPAIYINHDLETKSEISNFNFRTPFTVTDSNDVNILSSIASKPGNKYIDLSLEASGTLYTAPFNGVMLFFAKPTGSGYIQLENITSSVIQQVSFTSLVDHAVYVPVLAGDQIYVRYSNVELSQEYNRLRFIADKGVN